MGYRLRRLYEPEFYQGSDSTARYFEGWYYKIVTEDRALALIPGVTRRDDDPHAFVQHIDGSGGSASYHRYELHEFSYGRDVFWVSVGGSRFSLQEVSARLPGLNIDLRVREPQLWRGTILQPGTMGWYSFVPFMECKHGIIVMDAVVSGAIDGTSVEGRLYVEKDYGRSFPNAWIWLQSNSFGEPGASVTASIANVPFVGGAFTGFLAGLAVDGELHKFTTYLGARIETIEVDDRSVLVVLANARERLEITAAREAGAELVAPADGAMRGRVVETLRSSVDVRLTSDGVIRFEGRGVSAGLEVVNPDRLVPSSRPR